MSVDEAARHQLYSSLEETLGPEPTSTLMSLLPPVGWADVATKQDFGAVRAELAAMERVLRVEIRSSEDRLRAELYRALRTQTLTLVGTIIAVNGLTWSAITFGS
jgi:hypothetical protein